MIHPTGRASLNEDAVKMLYHELRMIERPVHLLLRGSATRSGELPPAILGM